MICCLVFEEQHNEKFLAVGFSLRHVTTLLYFNVYLSI